MTQQEYYSGRASGMRHAMGLLEVFCDTSHGYRLGAKALSERVKQNLRAAIEEERHLTADHPAALQSLTVQP